ncbi:MAG: TVP38/TMEM64 family protein [Halanaeroarchaeum sp.]
MRPTARRVGLEVSAVVLLALAVRFRPKTVEPLLRSAVSGPWFPLLLVGLYVVRPFLGWPIVVLSALVGFRYGLVPGVPIALLGAAFSSLLPYGAGRVAPDAGGLVGRFVGGSRRYFGQIGGLRGVVAARLAPLPAEPVSAAAGAGGVAAPAFVLGTVVGELPWTIAAVSVGRSTSVFAVGDVTAPTGLLALGVAGAMALLAGPIYRTYVSSG